MTRYEADPGNKSRELTPRASAVETDTHFPTEPTVLIISTKFDPHVDIIIKSLSERHIPFVRFNTEDYPLKSSLSVLLIPEGHQEKLKVPNNPEIEGKNIRSVWYRRPAPFEFPPKFSPQAHVFAQRETTAAMRGLWSLLDCIWVNHPDNNRVAEIKLNQLKKAIQLGFEIPRTLVTNNSAEARKFIRNARGDVVVKTLSGGAVLDEEDPTAIFTNILKPNDVKHLRDVYLTPTLFQEYVPKSLEIRATVVGNQVFAAELHSQSLESTRHDWRRETLVLVHRPHQLPKDIEQKCLSLIKSFGLHFGAMDLILTPQDRYIFLELNPNGQWAWIEDLTGLPIADALIDVLTGKISNQSP